MQQVTEVYEARVTLGRLGRLGNLSFNALFCGRPSSVDLIAAIEHKRNIARVFKLASPDSFIDVVKRLGMPVPGNVMFDPDGSYVHVITIDLHPVQSGAIPQVGKPKIEKYEPCVLCHKLPDYKIKGNAGEVLYHYCSGDSSSLWFLTETEWTNRNERLRRQYK